MPLNPTYSVGTVSVSAGASIVTGTGTQFLGAGIRAGDVFERAGLSVTIASVESPTQFTLVKPWPGVSGSGIYEVRFTGDASRVLGGARQAIQRFEELEPMVSNAAATIGPGIADYPTLAAAVADNPDGSIRINYDERGIPSDFAGVLLEYTKRATNLNIQQTGLGPYNSMRLFRGQFPKSHPGLQINGVSIEMQSFGSGVNGPSAVENGLMINVAKRGFATANPVGGAINCLYLFGRQDGPKGLPQQDPGSSDFGGVIGGFTIVEDAGWCGAWESTTSQIMGPVAKDGFAAFEQMRQIQLAFGVINGNGVGGTKTYGFSIVANKGVGLTAAYYAGKAAGTTWDSLFLGQDAVRIDGIGNYRSIMPSWLEGAFNLERDKTVVNGDSTLRHRGTGSLRILAMEAASLSLGTGGTIRLRLQADGHLVPATDRGVNLGQPAVRYGAAYLGALDVAGAITLPADMPVYADNTAAASLAVGRVYRNAAGDLKVRY